MECFFFFILLLIATRTFYRSIDQEHFYSDLELPITTWKLANIGMLHCDCLTGFPQSWMYPEFISAQKKWFEKLNWIQGLNEYLAFEFLISNSVLILHVIKVIWKNKWHLITFPSLELCIYRPNFDTRYVTGTVWVDQRGIINIKYE